MPSAAARPRPARSRRRHGAGWRSCARSCSSWRCAGCLLCGAVGGLQAEAAHSQGTASTPLFRRLPHHTHPLAPTLQAQRQGVQAQLDVASSARERTRESLKHLKTGTRFTRGVGAALAGVVGRSRGGEEPACDSSLGPGLAACLRTRSHSAGAPGARPMWLTCPALEPPPACSGKH